MAALRAVIECISELPRRFKQAQTKTLVQILDERHVFDHLSNISDADMEQHLRNHTGLMDDWLAYSEDQRCSPAYYFIKSDDGYEVARYPGGIKMRFADPAKACTAFIIREMDSLLALRDH